MSSMNLTCIGGPKHGERIAFAGGRGVEFMVHGGFDFTRSPGSSPPSFEKVYYEVDQIPLGGAKRFLRYSKLTGSEALELICARAGL